MTASGTALPVLEDGTIFRGRAWGAKSRALGEIVLSTGTTGCQEMFTNLSYRRQVIVVTAPHIGNTGINDEDPESSHIWAAGFVVRDIVRHASNWHSCHELRDGLISQGIVGIVDADMRTAARHVRKWGAVRAGVSSGDTLSVGAQYSEDEAVASLVHIVVEPPAMNEVALAAEVSTGETYVMELLGDFEDKEPIVRAVAVDLGIKSRTPYHLVTRGMCVYMVPSTVSFTDIEALKPDGVFFSDRPGDPPIADRGIGVLRAVLDAGIPYLGICSGHQLFSRALSYGTYKLDYGYRGINRPVKEVATGCMEIIAHSHGSAVNAPAGESSIAPLESGRYGCVETSHVGLNDGVAEDLHALDILAFSVQYHPEAATGPHDDELLFDRLISLMTATKETH